MFTKYMFSEVCEKINKIYTIDSHIENFGSTAIREARALEK